LSRQALEWVLNHYVTLPEQSVGRTASRAEMEALLREPPPEQGQDFTRALAEFDEKVCANAFRTNHPRFLAFIPGAPSFLSVLGDLLCAGTNFFCGVWLEASGPSMVEVLAVDWFAQFLGCPPRTRGIFTSGGSEANLTALVTAREGLDYDDRSRALLYVNEQRHWSVDRAARIIGFRPDQIRPVSTDAELRLGPVDLKHLTERDRLAGKLPWAVVANAGATNTGACDNLDALADVCQENRLWLHVDAAYGWAATLSASGQTLLHGIGRADSITLDPHKWFGQTFETGCVLVRDGKMLARTFGMRPEYMQDVEPADDQINFADYSLALTRRFRALRVWLSVKVLGLAWFRSLVDHCMALAALAEALLKSSLEFEFLSRNLSIVCFRCVPRGFVGNDEELDDLNLELIEKLRATGRAFISSTRIRGRVVLRFCFVNWRTTAADVEEIVVLLNRLASELR
jgi:glutamate/tyrosine decarboxylase-like PLP-dependent enzyme